MYRVYLPLPLIHIYRRIGIRWRRPADWKVRSRKDWSVRLLFRDLWFSQGNRRIGRICNTKFDFLVMFFRSVSHIRMVCVSRLGREFGDRRSVDDEDLFQVIWFRVMYILCLHGAEEDHEFVQGFDSLDRLGIVKQGSMLVMFFSAFSVELGTPKEVPQNRS